MPVYPAALLSSGKGPIAGPRPAGRDGFFALPVCVGTADLFAAIDSGFFRAVRCLASSLSYGF